MLFDELTAAMTFPTEDALIEQARLDPQAFGVLYDRYVDRIYAYTLRQTADRALAQDITAATFENALRALQRQPWRGGSFCAWLYRIARNELIRHHRLQNRFSPLRADYPSETDVEGSVARDHQQQALRSALARLSAVDREVLSLRFFEGLASAEVGEILGCSVQNVYLRLHRALERLRRQLSGRREFVEEMEQDG